MSTRCPTRYVDSPRRAASVASALPARAHERVELSLALHLRESRELDLRAPRFFGMQFDRRQVHTVIQPDEHRLSAQVPRFTLKLALHV